MIIKAFLFFLFFAPQTFCNAQSLNELIINKLSTLESDTNALLTIIKHPRKTPGDYNIAIDQLNHRIRNQIDTFLLIPNLKKIISENKDVFFTSKIKSVLLLNIEYDGEQRLSNEFLIVRSNALYAFYIDNSNNIFRSKIDDKIYKRFRKFINKESKEQKWGNIFLIRELKPEYETKAKLIVMNYSITQLVGTLEQYFVDIVFKFYRQQSRNK